MKIGIIGPAWPLRGGLADFDERFARELQTLGHEVVLYSYALQYPSFLFPGKTQYTDAPAPPDLRIHTIINSVNPLNWLSVGNRIKEDRPDLLVVRYWLPFMGPALGTILRRVKTNKHTRVITLADNIMPHEKRPGDSLFTNYFIKPVDAFATMSDEVMGDLKKLTHKPAIRVHHPLYDSYGPAIDRNKALKKLQLPADKTYLLFFGFIRKYKGLDLLLEAMADERLKQQDIRLIVAGEYYGDKDFYEQIIAKHQLQNRVHLFTDFIPNQEVPVYFSAADLVVLPYRSATNSGITQVAYFFEKPMIATNVGGLPEAVPDGKAGLVCAPEPHAIADSILAFLQPGSLPGLQQSLQEEKEKYSWKNFSEKLVSFSATIQ
jgi:glycosyltransferase involved in cell wall biosynthesis